MKKSRFFTPSWSAGSGCALLLAISIGGTSALYDLPSAQAFNLVVHDGKLFSALQQDTNAAGEEARILLAQTDDNKRKKKKRKKRKKRERRGSFF